MFNALVGVFCNAERRASRYLDQECAGRLLLALKPPSPPDVRAVIKRILPTWNLSVERLPRYFEAVVGRDPVLQVLDVFRTQVCSEQEQRANETFRFGFVPGTEDNWRNIAIPPKSLLGEAAQGDFGVIAFHEKAGRSQVEFLILLATISLFARWPLPPCFHSHSRGAIRFARCRLGVLVSAGAAT